MSNGQGDSRVAVRTAEAASRLGLGKTIVRQLVRDGELRSFTVGRAVLIPLTELDRFVAERLAESGKNGVHGRPALDR
jgi:excisionase family DNA binding protein